MSLSETRFGANAPGMPGPVSLPSLSTALSRRAALFGAVTVAGVTAAACAPVEGRAAALSANDARLVALADAYEKLDRETDAMGSEAPGYDDLIGGFTDIEWEMQNLPADSLAGVVAKARLCQSTTARSCAANDHVLSVVDDLWRLFGGAR